MDDKERYLRTLDPRLFRLRFLLDPRFVYRRLKATTSAQELVWRVFNVGFYVAFRARALLGLVRAVSFLQILGLAIHSALARVYARTVRNLEQAREALSFWFQRTMRDLRVLGPICWLWGRLPSSVRLRRGLIQLVHLPQWNLSQPPLGIAYLAAFMRAQGYRVAQRDFSIELYAALPKSQKHILQTCHHEKWIDPQCFKREIFPVVEPYARAWIRELARHPASIVGFTLLSTSKRITLYVAEVLKRVSPDKVIVIGGPQLARYEEGSEIAALPFVDYVVTDEGEETFHELVLAVQEGRPVCDVKGVLFKEGGAVVDTGARALLKRLDQLPFPCFDGLPLHLYTDLNLPILGSRGCVYSCTFCSETVFWRRYRFRTADSIFAEFQHQSRTYGVKGFYIVDSLINGNVRELEKLCDLIIESGLEVYWGGKASVHALMSRKLIDKMCAAGCRNLDYGIESGSQKVLNDMHKRFKVSTAEEVIRNTALAGIQVGTFFLIGFPTESEEDFQKSLTFMRKNYAYIDHVTPGHACGIQKGTDLYNHPETYGIRVEPDGWYSEHTSPVIRQERLGRFVEELKALGVGISFMFLQIWTGAHIVKWGEI